MKRWLDGIRQGHAVIAASLLTIAGITAGYVVGEHHRHEATAETYQLRPIQQTGLDALVVLLFSQEAGR